SGRITRGEVVSQFQPGSDDGAPNNRVELLLSTDLLSEGVNLQGADVVIHLDLPWTAARLEQRTGRAARLGSPFTTVHVYTLRPPASARAYLESETIITTKWTAANAIIGNSTTAPFAGRPVQRDERRSVPRQTERLRALLECWRSSKVPLVPDTTPFVASVESETDGFVAVLQYEDRVALLCGTAAGISADLETVASSLADIRDETLTEPDVAATAIQRVEEWIGMERASHVAGLATTSELVRRRRLLEKIDSTVRSAAPHQRPARTRLAVSARATATRFLSAAAEAELELLERSTLPPDMWLQAVAEFSPTHPKPFLDQELLPPHIIAVLLLTRPPPAFECGGG
ncbi:MAG TPA: C-terminal helicase domain-containing protein, partial [Gemmatimonadaceae bacterium]|nr:C-terminal helicase domain-containing protein [Gemmatimonadaceae bacterium]